MSQTAATTLIAELERIRTQRGWSKSQMAKTIGVSRQYYHHITTGDRSPGAEVLQRAADALELRWTLTD